MTDDDETNPAQDSPGGSDALAELLERCVPLVLGVVKKRLGPVLRSREESLDLAQSVCRQALENLDHFEFRSDEQFRAWLLALVERKIVDRYRELLAGKRDIRRERPFPVPGSEDAASRTPRTPDKGPATLAAADDEVERLRAAIAALPEELREALRLHQIVGLAYEEVGRRLGLSPEQARRRVLKAKVALAASLGHGPDDV